MLPVAMCENVASVSGARSITNTLVTHCPTLNKMFVENWSHIDHSLQNLDSQTVPGMINSLLGRGIVVVDICWQVVTMLPIEWTDNKYLKGFSLDHTAVYSFYPYMGICWLFTILYAMALVGTNEIAHFQVVYYYLTILCL